ncbi:MAG: hypothetical protein FWG68_03120 [Defluviitaleaceae bacterium]|nr:hypothetical protein [Defluviitaleaceae bacterium]
MKFFKKFVALLAFACLATNITVAAAPYYGAGNNSVAQSPYRITSTAEETRAVVRMRNGSIPVTNVKVPEIMNGEVNGIIITDQDLSEAIAVLNEAYVRYNYVISNLVTPYIKFSEWQPTAEDLERLSPANNAVEFSIGARATTPPTQFPPSVFTQHNWSGTINFTFTRYLIPATQPWQTGNSGNFLSTSADTPHHVTYFNRNGVSLGAAMSVQRGGIFVTGGMTQPVDFYGRINNQAASGPSRNATWEIDMN